MQKLKSGTIWLYLLFLALVVPPHVIGIARFATIDEPWWVISGSNYYYALTHRDFSNTIYDYHPAVTTTWMVTAGMLSYFPEYRGFGEGYFDVRKPNFDEFLLEHGKQTAILLRNSRLFQSALIILMALAGFHLLKKLVDPPLALLAMVLAADAPYFLGHSRLLNHEGMLASFVLASLLGMFVYLQERRLPYLLFSAAAFGLAQLTKSSSIVVAGTIGLMLFRGLFNKENGEKAAGRILDGIRIFGIWLAVAAGVYVLLWPGMWAAPGSMLYQVYGNAFSYAFQGARLDVTENLEPAQFQLGNGLGGILSYLRIWALRSTPIAWAGLLAGIPVLFSRSVKPAVKWLMGYLALTAFLFIAMFGIAQGRNSSHYILSSFFCLDVIAGLGLGLGLVLLSQRWAALRSNAVGLSAIGLLILAQIASALPYYPYYYTYENPVVEAIRGSNGPYAYGEGLDQAAAYLAQKPDAAGTRVFAYAGMGPFSYFYPGRTEVLKKIYLIDPPQVASIIEGMKHADYMVVYSAAQDRLPESAAFLRALEEVTPEKEITIHGQMYVKIYRLADVPPGVYEELEKIGRP